MVRSTGSSDPQLVEPVLVGHSDDAGVDELGGGEVDDQLVADGERLVPSRSAATLLPAVERILAVTGVVSLLNVVPTVERAPAA